MEQGFEHLLKAETEVKLNFLICFVKGYTHLLLLHQASSEKNIGVWVKVLGLLFYCLLKME